MHVLSLWNASFELFISICNAPFEFYNTNNLNENEIVITFKGVDKLIGELKVKIMN